MKASWQYGCPAYRLPDIEVIDPAIFRSSPPVPHGCWRCIDGTIRRKWWIRRHGNPVDREAMVAAQRTKDREYARGRAAGLRNARYIVSPATHRDFWMGYEAGKRARDAE